MTSIKLLDEELINKIAAGEVIERPASVVKELIENALDASATRVQIEVEDYGKKLIRIVDDGIGMEKEDLQLSVYRHATSKIRNVDDLFDIKTLGFRGEALASIAAVSHLEITSKTAKQVSGHKLVLEGGKFLSLEEVGCNKGTAIEVRDLFFNTPARKKFMKTDTSELRAIADVVTRYALLYNAINFKLTHNGHVMLSSSATDMLNNIASIYGNDIAKNLLEVEEKSSWISLSGFISKPQLLRNDRSYQSIFVNGRYVKEEMVSKAIADAYHSLIFLDKAPVVILSITIDPQKIDVNVHPSKERIKITQSQLVYDFVFNAIRKKLLESNLVNQHAEKEEKQEQFNIPFAQFNTTEKNLEKDEQSFFIQDAINVKAEEKSFEKVPSLRVLGSIHKTFFFAESTEGLVIIDQHVVQERILYEKFMNQHMGKCVSVQSLLQPEMLRLPAVDAILVKNNLEKLKGLGFALEDFGDNSFILRSAPSIFERVQANVTRTTGSPMAL